MARKSLLYCRLDCRSLLVFLFTVSISLQCDIILYPEPEAQPEDRLAAIEGTDVNLTCKATDCVGMVKIYIAQDGHDTGFDSDWCKNGIMNATYWDKTCSVNMNISLNGSNLQCVGIPGSFISNSIQLLVQDTLGSVTNVTVRGGDTIESLNISWSPVEGVYSGLTVTCTVLLNGYSANTTSHWITLDTSRINQCQPANLTITPFIDTLVGITTEWLGPINAPLNDTHFNYTIIIRENETTLTMKFEVCSCPGRISTHVILRTNSSTLPQNVPVTVNNCIGVITLVLPVDQHLLISLELQNSIGTTPQKDIFINTCLLQDASYTNGTDSSPPSVICTFTSDFTVNDVSTGCSVSYMNLDSNVSGSASITRQKKEHFVEKNLTNITSGKYTLHFSVSPSTNYNCSISLNSVYINGTDSGEPTTTPIAPSGGHNNKLYWIILLVLLLISGVVLAVLVVLVVISRRKKEKKVQLEKGTGRSTIVKLDDRGNTMSLVTTPRTNYGSQLDEGYKCDINLNTTTTSSDVAETTPLYPHKNSDKSDDNASTRKLSVVLEETAFMNGNDTSPDTHTEDISRIHEEVCDSQNPGEEPLDKDELAHLKTPIEEQPGNASSQSESTISSTHSHSPNTSVNRLSPTIEENDNVFSE